jgi:hypothetical protein
LKKLLKALYWNVMGGKVVLKRPEMVLVEVNCSGDMFQYIIVDIGLNIQDSYLFQMIFQPGSIYPGNFLYGIIHVIPPL